MFESVHVCLYNTQPESKGVKERLQIQTRQTAVKGGNINWGLMVQVKDHLGNRWPQMNFLFLPVESDRAHNNPSPPTAPLRRPGEERALYWWLDFDLDLQVVQFIPTHPHNSPQHTKSDILAS